MAREELGLAVHQLRGISLQCFGDPPVQLLSGIAQKSPVGCFLHQRVLEGIDRIGRNAALKYQLGSERAGRERLAARPREAWRPRAATCNGTNARTPHRSAPPVAPTPNGRAVPSTTRADSLESRVAATGRRARSGRLPCEAVRSPRRS